MSEPTRNIRQPVFLVGFMCSGKSTLGVALARFLDLDFVDLDEFIVSRTGKSINAIFSEFGENYFRKIEKQSLEYLIKKYRSGSCIIALGGGSVCQPGVMERLNKVGLTVFLESSIDKLTERLMLFGDDRPLIADKSPEELRSYVEAKLASRRGFYEKSKLTFDSSRLENPREVDESVRNFIRLVNDYEATASLSDR